MNLGTVYQQITQLAAHGVYSSCSKCLKELRLISNFIGSLDTSTIDIQATSDEPGNTLSDTAGISNLHPVFEQIIGGWRAGYMD